MNDHQGIPDTASLEKAMALKVLNDIGNEVMFGSLFETQQTIIIFIRHFFCGSCQAYVAQLAQIRKEALVDAKVNVIVIGCGEWQPIKAYMETTGFSGEIYADPSRNLYHALGMNLETLARTPKGQEKRSYLVSGYFKNVVSSVFNGPIKHPTLVGKQGNISQLGGDFIFGPGAQCSFAHRMQNTEDHLEVAEIAVKAGVLFP